MNLEAFVKGSCDDFCPSNEIKMRTKEKLLHFYELNPSVEYTYKQKHLLIKCFGRSAAGTESPKSIDLRTFNSLFRTVDYLLTYIIMDNRKPYHYKYDFIFDRLRSVRQEIVIQNLTAVETIKLIEPMVMFLSFSSYELCQSSIDTFDPKICSQHLQECLKRLLCCYDEISQQNAKHLPNREFFECLYVLFNLGNVDALNRAISLATLMPSELFKLCLAMSLNYFNCKFYNSIRIIKLLPPILCGIAVLSLQRIRREILLRFSSAYHSKILSVPGKWLTELLLYEDVQHLVSDCEYYKIDVNLESKDIKFNKFDFDQKISVKPPRHETFVDNKLLAVRISDVLLFK